MNNLNKTAKLAFYNARKSNGDVKTLSKKTGLTSRYINYVMRGERKINEHLADAMYFISRHRMTNKELKY